MPAAYLGIMILKKIVLNMVVIMVRVRRYVRLLKKKKLKNILIFLPQII